MTSIHNFEAEFSILIENSVPRVIKKLVDEQNAFDSLTQGLHTILASVANVLDREGKGLMSIEYTEAPSHDEHFIISMDIDMKHTTEHKSIQLSYLGGVATHVSVIGVDKYLPLFRHLKGAQMDIDRGEVRFDVNNPADVLAAAFASIFFDFYQ